MTGYDYIYNKGPPAPSQGPKKLGPLIFINNIVNVIKFYHNLNGRPYNPNIYYILIRIPFPLYRLKLFHLY